MDTNTKKFADILFPRNINRLTYIIPDQMSDRCLPGMVAEAPLRGKPVKGIVMTVHDKPPSLPQGKRLNPLIDISGTFRFPLSLLSLVDWVSGYYMSTEGLALKGLLFSDVLEPMKKPRTRVRPEYGVVNFSPIPECSQSTILREGIKRREFRSFLFHAKSLMNELSMIAELIRQTRNIIILVPEKYDISLLLPILDREARDRFCLLHSDMGKQAKIDAYRGLMEGRYDIVAGTMQTVFVPLFHPSLIVVFKEHSEFYKHEETPMYNVRDAAVKRGSIENIPVLLTSCSPSFESYSNALKGKYTLVEDSSSPPKPDIRIINAAGSEGLITFPLKKAIEQTIADKKDVLIILNRKGHSILKCRDCGHGECCPRCDVPYVFHMAKILKCHYCGKTEKVPDQCPVCHGIHFTFTTTGTEKAFDVLKREFDADITLIDSEHGSPALKKHRSGSVIIGTELALRIVQPFTTFGLTALLNADIQLQRPDFRSFERFLQQVIYLTSFNEEGSALYLQTYDWKNPLFTFVKQFDYAGFYASEIRKRKDFHYPPFYRMALLTLKKASLKESFVVPGRTECEVLGPVLLRGAAHVEFLLKCGSGIPIQKHIREIAGKITEEEKALKIDVDPLLFF
ncbi:MAG: primosomal protein N' [bacterium]